MKTPSLWFVIGLMAFGCARQDETADNIVFAPKAFYDSAQTTDEGYVYAAGTLAGDGVTYKNNTVAVACYQDRMECLTYGVEQNGPNQVSRLDAPSSYPVTKWDAYEIVAAGPSDSVHCRKVTISVGRRTETVVWVDEPINQSSSACKDADTRLLKWTIEDSPGWKAIHSK
jgi:hypothetical protein